MEGKEIWGNKHYCITTCEGVNSEGEREKAISNHLSLFLSGGDIVAVAETTLLPITTTVTTTTDTMTTDHHGAMEHAHQGIHTHSLSTETPQLTHVVST